MPEPPRRQVFLGTTGLLFAVSTAATLAWCRSMSGMGEIPMLGGWTLSMAWVPMCGQTWAGAAASFVGMWTVMMMAMMLPSLVPMLWRYRLALGRQSQGDLGEMRLGRLTAILRVMGVMNASAMVVITAAITAERLAPAGQRIAHAIGALSVGVGVLLTARAVWPG